jgi:D-3-phosphoglycerate dehydrogenase / 2-oxoglutarate reductase
MATTQRAMISDCDHESVDIERAILEPAFGPVPLHACRTETELLRYCAGAEGLLVQYAPITASVLKKLVSCKGIVRYGVGVDNIDLRAAADAGVIVSNVPDYGTDEVSDHALALLLTLLRKVYRADRLVKAGVWDFRQMRPVVRLRNQTLGIVGLGRIGMSLARKVQPLGMKIVAWDPYIQRNLVPDSILIEKLETVLAESDAISVHCPLNSETRNMLDERHLAMMKHGAVLVNTSRGGIVDEMALSRALNSGALSGAALDVFADEPIKASHPLLAHPDFICTPHMAWHSTEAEHDLKRKAAEELFRILKGEAPLYQMNKAI